VASVEINLVTIDLGLFHCQARTEGAHFYHDNCKQIPPPVRLVGPMWNQRGRGRILRIRICWSEEGWTSDDESQHGPQGRTQGVLRPPLGFRHPAAVRLARGSSDHRNSDGHHRDISGGARGKIRFGKICRDWSPPGAATNWVFLSCRCLDARPHLPDDFDPSAKLQTIFWSSNSDFAIAASAGFE
jgi:hypothetical protein